MKTGNTWRAGSTATRAGPPQWSPAMKTGNTRAGRPTPGRLGRASMEPGHEDREYLALSV